MSECKHSNTAFLCIIEGRSIRLCLRCGVLLDQRVFEHGVAEYDAEAKENAHE
jgi:hypothetical protein